MRFSAGLLIAGFSVFSHSAHGAAQMPAARSCSPVIAHRQLNIVNIDMPYHGKRVYSCEETLPDGTVVKGRSTYLEWRDSQGRLRIESLDPDFAGTESYLVQVFDPADHVFWTWSVGKDSPHQAVTGSWRPGGEFVQRPTQKFRFGPYLHSRGPNFRDVRLPPTWVHGAYATGDRYTQICAPGQMGNNTNHPVEMTTENWLSVDLGEIVESRNHEADGRREMEDLFVLDRRDPALSVFRPPANYEILQSPAVESAGTPNILTKRIGPKKSRRSMIIVQPAQR